MVTQNGKPKYVIQDANDYEEQQQTIALLKLINLSEAGLIELGDAFGDDLIQSHG